ncbi:MAG: IS66 family insertion sequence element accessory protein TnpB [Eubacterium sp.]|nr:IS66 family insertion sequence element accessory protein TnpB [Eubacterium sp.]
MYEKYWILGGYRDTCFFHIEEFLSHSQMEKIYIRTRCTDMRKQLDGLIDIIRNSFRLDSYSNSLFLFCGKRTDRIRAVHYEGDGVCLFYKCYENGCLQGCRHKCGNLTP